MKKNNIEDRLIKECKHNDISIEKSPVGDKHYGQCKDCPLTGGFADTKGRAKFNLEQLINQEK